MFVKRLFIHLILFALSDFVGVLCDALLDEWASEFVVRFAKQRRRL